MNAQGVGVGVLITMGLYALLMIAHNIGEWSAQAEIKRKCELFGVVDLPGKGAMFYCSRKPEAK